MKHRSDWYEILSKKYTDEELVEGYVFPVDLSEEEWDQANEELRKYRFERRKNRTERQCLISEIMRLRSRIRKYIEYGIFDEEFSFGKILDAYIQILQKTKKDFASDIALHNTKLSRLINERETPNLDLMYRLEKHCDHLIPATYWWQLVARKQEHLIETNQDRRKAEEKRVRNPLQLSQEKKS